MDVKLTYTCQDCGHFGHDPTEFKMIRLPPIRMVMCVDCTKELTQRNAT